MIVSLVSEAVKSFILDSRDLVKGAQYNSETRAQRNQGSTVNDYGRS